MYAALSTTTILYALLCIKIYKYYAAVFKNNKRKKLFDYIIL